MKQTNARAPWARSARVALAALCLAATAAHADTPPPADVISFGTSATMEVPMDVLSVTLQAVRDGAEASVVQAQLKQALDAALTEAKKSAQPGAMDVRTGNFSLFPRYGKDGRIGNWTGQANLVLEGKDIARVAQTAGQINGMNVVSVNSSISRELVEKYETEVTAQAIQKYRAQADTLARQFGARSYTLREVSVQSGVSTPGPRPLYMRKDAAVAAEAAAPLPVEQGKGTIQANVNGSVQLTR